MIKIQYEMKMFAAISNLLLVHLDPAAECLCRMQTAVMTTTVATAMTKKMVTQTATITVVTFAVVGVEVVSPRQFSVGTLELTAHTLDTVRGWN